MLFCVIYLIVLHFKKNKAKKKEVIYLENYVLKRKYSIIFYWKSFPQQDSKPQIPLPYMD